MCHKDTYFCCITKKKYVYFAFSCAFAHYLCELCAFGRFVLTSAYRVPSSADDAAVRDILSIAKRYNFVAFREWHYCALPHLWGISVELEEIDEACHLEDVAQVIVDAVDIHVPASCLCGLEHTEEQSQSA